MAILYTVTKAKDAYTLDVQQDTSFVLYYVCGTKNTKVLEADVVANGSLPLTTAKDGKYKLVLTVTGETDVEHLFTVFSRLQNSLILDICNLLACVPIPSSCDQAYNVCLSKEHKLYLQHKDLFVKLLAFQSLYFDEISEGLSNAFSDFVSAGVLGNRCSIQTAINKLLNEECLYGSAKDSTKLMAEFVTYYYYAIYFIDKNLATGDQDELDFIEEKFLVETIQDTIIDVTCINPTETENLFNETLQATNTKPTVNNKIITVPNGLTNNLFQHTFATSDFTDGFNDVQGDSPLNIKFSLLPVRGTFLYDGNAVNLNTPYLVSNANKFTYEVTITETKNIFDILQFQVSDDNNLNELYSDMANVTINTAAYVNQPITQLGDLTLNKANRENHVYTVNDFTTNLVPPYSDPEGDSLDAIRIDSLPAAGSLQLSGSPVSINDIIPAASITAGNLVYVAPDTNSSDTNIWNFSARDSGSLQWVS